MAVLARPTNAQLSGQLLDGVRGLIVHVLRAGARTALADGPPTDLERSVLSSTGAELGMIAAHTQGLIAMVEQQAQSR